MEHVKKIINSIIELFKKPGVIKVEHGYLFKNGWITSTLAIVVSVMRKIPASFLLYHELLPENIEGVPVDVITADLAYQIEATNMNAIDLKIHPLESNIFVSKYNPLPRNPIDNIFFVHEQILCHASPDSGWPVLKAFISDVKEHLTIAMYDFNAGYIAKELITATKAMNADIDLILDDDLSPVENEIQDKLDFELKDKFRRTIAFTGGSGLFESAYHEKVMVKDHRSFWLSSGN